MNVNYKQLLNEEVTRTIFEDFYFLMTIAAFFNDKLKRQYLEAELSQYSSAQKYFNNMPKKFAIELYDDIAPIILDEATHGKVNIGTPISTYVSTALNYIGHNSSMDPDNLVPGYIGIDGNVIDDYNNDIKTLISIGKKAKGKYIEGIISAAIDSDVEPDVNNEVHSSDADIDRQIISAIRAFIKNTFKTNVVSEYVIDMVTQSVLRSNSSSVKYTEANEAEKTIRSLIELSKNGNLQIAASAGLFRIASSVSGLDTIGKISHQAGITPISTLTNLIEWFGFQNINAAMKFKDLIQTVPFYESDPLFEKYYSHYLVLERKDWTISLFNSSYGGAGWAAAAWLLKRLYLFISGDEATKNEWQHISSLTNAIMQIEHNNGALLDKIEYRYYEVFMPGLDLKTFATHINEFENVSGLAEMVRECAVKAIRNYRKYAENTGSDSSKPAIEYLSNTKQTQALMLAKRSLKILRTLFDGAFSTGGKKYDIYNREYSSEQDLPMNEDMFGYMTETYRKVLLAYLTRYISYIVDNHKAYRYLGIESVISKLKRSYARFEEPEDFPESFILYNGNGTPSYVLTLGHYVYENYWSKYKTNYRSQAYGDFKSHFFIESEDKLKLDVYGASHELVQTYILLKAADELFGETTQ